MITRNELPDIARAVGWICVVMGGMFAAAFIVAR